MKRPTIDGLRPSDSAPDVHGPDHVDCPTCDPGSLTRIAGARSPSIVRVRARGEKFRIVQVVGNLLVCSRANGNCCCGWAEKGRMPFENAVWSDEWEKRRLRNRVHLTFTGCLGPCEVGNNVLLQIHGRSIWFKDLNEQHLPGRVFDFIEATLAQGAVAPVPDELAGHVFDRYLTPNDRLPGMTDAHESSLPGPLDPEALDGLDPVCMMEVNPATAQFTLEHAGRTIAFCGPGCRREFLEDPNAFLPGLTPRGRAHHPSNPPR